MNETTEHPPIQLTPVEARVLGCLMEKELVTPDNYPLTLNSLMLACNQKTSREPLMNLTLAETKQAVNELSARDLLRVDYGDRSQRISHRFRQALRTDRRGQAVLTLLMLRRPATLNEIRTRTERMVEFGGMEEIEQTLSRLVERQPPLVVCIPKGPGQREDRYAHLLCGAPDLEALRNEPEAESSRRPALDPVRVDRLEARVATLEQQVAELLELITR